MIVVARKDEHMAWRLSTGSLPGTTAVPMTWRPQLLLQIEAAEKPARPRAARVREYFLMMKVDGSSEEECTEERWVKAGSCC